MKLLKTNDTHKTVSFCILTPDIEDRNGDVISEDEIIKTAHEFMQNISDKFLNVDHKDDTHISKDKFVYVESFVAPNDIIVGTNVVVKGSWYVGIKFLDEELYEDVKSGEYIGVSMEGYFVKS